jgi:hypothetical protein
MYESRLIYTKVAQEFLDWRGNTLGTDGASDKVRQINSGNADLQSKLEQFAEEQKLSEIKGQNGEIIDTSPDNLPAYLDPEAITDYLENANDSKTAKLMSDLVEGNAKFADISEGHLAEFVQASLTAQRQLDPEFRRRGEILVEAVTSAKKDLLATEEMQAFLLQLRRNFTAVALYRHRYLAIRGDSRGQVLSSARSVKEGGAMIIDKALDQINGQEGMAKLGLGTAGLFGIFMLLTAGDGWPSTLRKYAFAAMGLGIGGYTANLISEVTTGRSIGKQLDNFMSSSDSDAWRGYLGINGENAEEIVDTFVNITHFAPTNRQKASDIFTAYLNTKANSTARANKQLDLSGLGGKMKGIWENISNSTDPDVAKRYANYGYLGIESLYNRIEGLKNSNKELYNSIQASIQNGASLREVTLRLVSLDTKAYNQIGAEHTLAGRLLGVLEDPEDADHIGDDFESAMNDSNRATLFDSMLKNTHMYQRGIHLDNTGRTQQDQSSSYELARDFGLGYSSLSGLNRHAYGKVAMKTIEQKPADKLKQPVKFGKDIYLGTKYRIPDSDTDPTDYVRAAYSQLLEEYGLGSEDGFQINGVTYGMEPVVGAKILGTNEYVLTVKITTPDRYGRVTS